METLGILHGHDTDVYAVWMDKINKIKSGIQIWKKTGFNFKGQGIGD